MGRVSEKITTFLPWSEIEPEAQKQILNTAELPFVFKWVAVMPDCHYGKGATVGTVIATKGAVVPAAVGVDIGCGMIALQTQVARSDQSRSRLSERRHRGFRQLPTRPEMGAEVRASQSRRDDGPHAARAEPSRLWRSWARTRARSRTHQLSP